MSVSGVELLQYEISAFRSRHLLITSCYEVWVYTMMNRGREIRDLLRVLDVQMGKEDMSCLNSGIEMLWSLRFNRDKDGLIGL